MLRRYYYIRFKLPDGTETQDSVVCENDTEFYGKLIEWNRSGSIKSSVVNITWKYFVDHTKLPTELSRKERLEYYDKGHISI